MVDSFYSVVDISSTLCTSKSDTALFYAWFQFFFSMMANQVNDAGRGFNIVALDSNTLKPSKVTHMDTYTYGDLIFCICVPSLTNRTENTLAQTEISGVL